MGSHLPIFSMDFCCDDFKLYCSLQNGQAPNCRIVQYKERDTSWLRQFGKPRKGKYRFYVTLGYDEFSLDLPMLNILYCPYCSAELAEFYQGNVQPNETEGVTFPESP